MFSVRALTLKFLLTTNLSSILQESTHVLSAYFPLFKGFRILSQALNKFFLSEHEFFFDLKFFIDFQDKHFDFSFLFSISYNAIFFFYLTCFVFDLGKLVFFPFGLKVTRLLLQLKVWGSSPCRKLIFLVHKLKFLVKIE